MIQKQHPYRTATRRIESIPQNPRALEPWLFPQVVAHSVVVLSYGLLLAIATFCGFLMGIASMQFSLIAFSTGGTMILISTWKVYECAKQRERNLWTGRSLVTYDLHEWVHYSTGTLGCVVLSFANLWFLPALVFYIYSLVCLTKIANAAGAEQEDHLP
jgi:hypothetical protein